MSVFLLKRFATFIATLAVASVLVFGVLDVLPGNVAQVILGDTATPESLAALENKLGLDRPVLVRYADWVGGLLRGRTALSYSYDTPTATLIAERLQVTLPLALMAMAFTVLIGITLGVYAAARQNHAGDVGVMALSQLGIAVPSFWFAILLILLFAVKLQWVSAGGFPGWSEDDGGGLGPGWWRCCCRRSRWPRCRRLCWRAGRVRRCWRRCAKTTCAPRAPKASPAAPCCGSTCCATR